MFRGASVLAGKCLRSRSSRLAIVTGSLYFLYTRPSIHLDTPNVMEESLLRRLKENFLFDPEEVINDRLKEKEGIYSIADERVFNHCNYLRR
jgi:hypothetical protein